MTDAFDKWINSMSEDEYDDRLDDSNPFGFTDNQKSKALNIRQAPTTEELEDLTLEQEFIEEPIDVEEPTGREREPREPLSRIRRFLTRVEQKQGAPIEIEQITVRKRLGGGAPIRTEPTKGIEGMKMTRPPIPLPSPIRPPIPTKVSVGSQVRGAILGAGKFIRRFFRV